MTWQMYGQEKHDEGLEEGLEALVHSLFPYHSEFSTLYQAIRANAVYANVTPEQVRKYYDPLVSKNNSIESN